MRKTPSPEKWCNITEEQQASNLTIAAYCLQNDLSKTTIYVARSTFNEVSGSFVRAKVTKHRNIIEQPPILLAIEK